MEKEQLSAYLKSAGRSKSAINRSLNALEIFEKWLMAEHGLTIDDEITLEIIETFIRSVNKGQKNLLMGLANVFDFQGKEALKIAAVQMRRDMLDQETKPMLLREFMGVDQSLIHALEAKEIRDAFQLLRICRTPEERKALANELNIAYDILLDLVRMADLSRLFAVKAVRARLYLDSGYDTVDKLAAEEPMALHYAMVKFAEKTGFNGVPTLPKEAEGTVKSAKELERWIVFEEDE